MTDDVLHTAGDGRLAGIVKPNDGQCHTQYDPSYNKTINTAAIKIIQALNRSNKHYRMMILYLSLLLHLIIQTYLIYTTRM